MSASPHGMVQLAAPGHALQGNALACAYHLQLVLSGYVVAEAPLLLLASI